MPLTPMPHLGKGGTGFQGTGPGSAAYLLNSLAAQSQVIVTGGAAAATLTATGLKTTSVVTSALMFAAGVPSVVTANVASIPTDNAITFDVDTSGNTVLVTWVDPPQG